MKYIIALASSYVAFTALAAPTPKTYLITADVYENGKLVSSPSLVTNDKMEAMLSQSSNEAKELLSLAVTPRAASAAPSDTRVELHITFKNQLGHDVVAGVKDFNTHIGQTETLIFDNNDLTHPMKVALTVLPYK